MAGGEGGREIGREWEAYRGGGSPKGVAGGSRWRGRGHGGAVDLLQRRGYGEREIGREREGEREGGGGLPWRGEAPKREGVVAGARGMGSSRGSCDGETKDEP